MNISLPSATRAQLLKNAEKFEFTHIGSALSCIDILVAVFEKLFETNARSLSEEEKLMLLRRHFVLSKGHAWLGLLSLMEVHKLIDLRELVSAHDALDEHPNVRIPGMSWATGSLGHGLSVASGFAYASKLAISQPAEPVSELTFCVLGDGECNEGSVWESVGLASTLNLSNLVALVDSNGWQATNRTQNVLSQHHLIDSFASFGWASYEVDGHNISEILSAIQRWRGSGRQKPLALICETVKGKGVRFMEDDNNWHYRSLDSQTLSEALGALGVCEDA